MSKDDRDSIIILNQPHNLQRRERNGKVRYSVSVTSEPLVHDFNPKELGEVVAKQIAETLREKIRGITATASASTLKARKVAAKAFGEGKRWAQRRYASGRMGPMPPNQHGDRAFNDSGRMAASIVAQAKDDEWRINMAASRLDPTTTDGELGVQRMYRRLVQLVPAFGNAAELLNEPAVRGAIDKSIQGMIVKAKATKDQLLETRAKAALDLVRQAIGLLGVG